MKLSVSYKQTDVGDDYDAILIGSGIGSLVSAAALARAGKKCLILERHYTAGGYTHVFKRRNYEWDVGIHYIVEVMRKTACFRACFATFPMEVSNEPIWARCATAFAGDDIYPFVRGRDAFADQLEASFDAADVKAIDEYILTVRSAARRRGFHGEGPAVCQQSGGQAHAVRRSLRARRPWSFAKRHVQQKAHCRFDRSIWRLWFAAIAK